MSLRRQRRHLDRLFEKLSQLSRPRRKPDIDIRPLSDDQVDRLEYLLRTAGARADGGGDWQPERLSKEEQEELESLIAQCASGP